MAVQIVQSFRTKPHKKLKHLSGCAGLGLYLDARYLIIRLPDSRVLKLLARSMILALFIVSFPCLGAISPSTSISTHLVAEGHEVGVADTINVELLPLFFRDLTNEGIFQKGQNAVFISSGNDEAIYRSQIMNDNEMEIISTKDSNRQSSIPNDIFDFVFVSTFSNNAKFIDRTLKVGGIVALQLNHDPSDGFQKPSNYKIVYLRRFDSTVLAMKKTGHASESGSTATQRRLFEYGAEAKKAALNKLEDVLLEPPRAASGKSRRYLKKTRYLPDLMGDSLERYPRRVFIDVGLPEKDGGSGTGWFAKYYPTRNKDFEVYNIESVTSSPSTLPQIGMPEWLKRNVKEEEYVVMKSDAEVVEEMVKSKTIRLVDELFLECKPQGHGGKENSSRRAYWECLALYGRLRDEGVAVHQWWG
ncbi:hypothetical protein FNV43_RR12411 [Rhamnella rubrinervis]|uniref:DUF7870 domain-containing protein n=1 Tax=Rhamnella rubrinervis TaxID=2594499 RepID=A0A8K0MIH3_9ROSA|nr:hypothetical protein FNV43_RR12411 [Rhamnella rubrinervis]